MIGNRLNAQVAYGQLQRQTELYYAAEYPKVYLLWRATSIKRRTHIPEVVSPVPAANNSDKL
jgi:hypothetical protein